MSAPTFDVDQLLETLTNLPVGTMAVVRLFGPDDPKEPDEDDKDNPYDMFSDGDLEIGSGTDPFAILTESGTGPSSISSLPMA